MATMFPDPFHYWAHVARRACKELLHWSGTMLIGLVIAFLLTVIELGASTMTFAHLVRDYGLTLVALYVLHLAKAAWLVYAELARCAEDIWSLKCEMREIKRRWPKCLFVDAPPNRLRWSPFIGEPETGMSGIELEKAIAWHDRFQKLTCPNTNVIASDWESTLAYLDVCERARRGLPATPLW
jgi:hypothetical protein